MITVGFGDDSRNQFISSIEDGRYLVLHRCGNANFYCINEDRKALATLSSHGH